jgi:hypothetical protein
MNLQVLAKFRKNLSKQEMIRILRSEFHKLDNSIFSKEEWLQHLKKSIIVPIYKNGN